MTLSEVLTQYVIPIISVIISVAFGVSGFTSSKKANTTLDAIGKAVETWQNQLIKAVIDLVNSSPSITGGKIYQAKIGSIQTLSEAIKQASTEIVKNPKPGDEGVAMQHHFNTLIERQERLIKDLLGSSAGPA